ncbi:MarR family winged helix-turn-helix transcriptional regulator [Alteribacillus bidgolensis]|uniref:DNA-binding transcriptional regulator, MarR family n=1 Tax=Alteribacillus bidgolensis TaxID=930129 RepID=A0A1G8K4S7_9BACI|nr:MarR family transcriptional regulator [Alteribacillus bidgolensis]SDI38486.1 DNA-binding transcriptional regulator, MarR family [Alteribacillus bidgolensis]
MDFNLQDLPSTKILSEYAEQIAEVDVLSVELCLTFLATARKLSDSYQFYFSKHGLSEGKFTILMLLYRDSNKALFPSELAERAGVTRGTVTGLLDGLEKSNWVKRQHNVEDRRKLSIVLTDEGKQRLEKMLPDHYFKTNALMKNLSDKEKELFKALLHKIYEGTSVLYE